MLAATEAGARPLGSADRGLRRGGLVDKERAPANAAHRTGEGRGRARSDRPPPPRQLARSDAVLFLARSSTSQTQRAEVPLSTEDSNLRKERALWIAHRYRMPSPPYV